jgi:hypothetical protein
MRPGMASFDVTWNDDRGQQTVEADDVVLTDGEYEFWRDGEVFLRVPVREIREIRPQADV